MSSNPWKYGWALGSLAVFLLAEPVLAEPGAEAPVEPSAQEVAPAAPETPAETTTAAPTPAEPAAPSRESGATEAPAAPPDAGSASTKKTAPASVGAPQPSTSATEPAAAPKTFGEWLQRFNARNSLELSIGDLSITGVDYDKGVHFFSLNVGYLISVAPWFSFGPWIGTPLLALRQGTVDFPAFWSFPFVGIKTVFGDKKRSIAGALNLGFLPSVGVYFRNFFLNLMYFPFDSPFKPFGGARNRIAIVELGYSIPFGGQP